MKIITIDRAVVEQALEALEMWIDETHSITQQNAITTLKAALAQEPQTTHSAECWRWHHKCAVAKIERECKHD